jgi:hypothetical protein
LAGLSIENGRHPDEYPSSAIVKAKAMPTSTLPQQHPYRAMAPAFRPDRRACLLAGMLAATGLLPPSAWAASATDSRFRRVPTQFIAALDNPAASSGTGAQAWGIWTLDPGPRGVALDRFAQLTRAGNVAPANWTFDNTDWWLEEHGLIMEQPAFPLAPRKYLVTGGRETTAVLTIHAPDRNKDSRWELDQGATLHDVTHLGCRSARYTPSGAGNACSPARARQSAFPVTPGGTMPPVDGCHKQDYAVLFVIGLEAN